MRIGILALQGAFAEHAKMLEKLGVEHFEIRQKKDLEREMDGLILPGGESTVMGKLLEELDMLMLLKTKIQAGLPVFGTCAGLILLADEVEGEENNRCSRLKTMQIKVKRNAYGRQLGSFHTEEEFKECGKVPMTFIRAPYITKVTKEVEILATVEGKIVAARQGKQLVTTFHPELDYSEKIHKYFLNFLS